MRNRKGIAVLIISFFIFSNILLINSGKTNNNLVLSDTSIRSIDSNTWTFLVYLDGDNNLEKYGLKAIKDMEFGFEGICEISIIVLIDRHPKYDSSEGNWTGARIYKIRKNLTNNIDSELLLDLGEINVGNPDILEFFINFGFENYPAKNYLLTLWNHGGGSKGICYDYSETDYNNRLTIDEIRKAIEKSEFLFSERINIISLLGCNMGVIDVAYELHDLSDYLIFSQETGYSEAIDWTILTKTICDYPLLNSYELVYEIIRCYSLTDHNMRLPTTLSAINLEEIPSVVNEISNLANNLSNIINNGHIKSITKALDNTLIIDNIYVDIADFIKNLRKNETISYLYPALNQSMIKLLTTIRKAVEFKYQNINFHNNTCGLSIVFPYPRLLEYETYFSSSVIMWYYEGLDWLENCTWKYFLQEFYDDTDNDALADWFEVKYNLNSTSMDSNNDGINDGNEDHDSDELTNYYEYQNGSNPYSNDTDLDGLTDYQEIMEFNSLPFKTDTDLDGYSDYEEVIAGTDPNDVQDYPNKKELNSINTIEIISVIIPFFVILLSLVLILLFICKFAQIKEIIIKKWNET